MTSKTSATTQYMTFIRQRYPFQATVEMDSTASSNAGATWCALPCYNVEWIDVEITVATNDVTVTVTQDYSGGTIVLPTQSYALTAGATKYHCIAVVPGAQATSAVTKGSHVVTVTLTSTVGGAHGTCTGRVHLYGKKLV